jgi:hypothetical protein
MWARIHSDYSMSIMNTFLINKSCVLKEISLIIMNYKIVMLPNDQWINDVALSIVAFLMP